MGDTKQSRLLLVGIGLFLLTASLTAPIDHDESQYVAAVALMREGLPYRDWPYLQTPLQPLVLSPLSLLPAGWLLVAARLANVVFALVACWAALRLLRGRVAFGIAASTVTAMAATNAFLFGSELARNDILPIMLLGLALVALTDRDRPDVTRYGLGGLLLGLAISAKISLALPVAGVGLALLWHLREAGLQRVLAVAAGGILGLLPCLLLFALAPEPFVFGVFTYNLEAPQQFWSAVGREDDLTPAAKLFKLGEEAVRGATAVAMLLWLSDLRRSGLTARLLDGAIVGGLIAAYMPDPFFRQYLIPLLLPLFVRAALALPGCAAGWRHLGLGVGAVTAIYGALPTLSDMVEAARGSVPLFQSVARARAVATVVRGSRIVTLAPEQVAGSDVQLDPRFAAGPFLFRTKGELARRATVITRAPTADGISLLDRSPPQAVLTGGERRPRPPIFPRGVDAPLDDWARTHGYRPFALPGEGWTLWLAPTLKAGPEGPPSRVTLP